MRASNGLRPAVFLDKDGTLIEDVPYNVDPARVRLMAGTIPGLRLLHAAGYALIVITNQAGVARGYFAEAELNGLENHLRLLLAAERIPLTGFYYCPHHPEGTVAPYAVACGCRKPAAGMITQAAQEHGIDCGRSWFIGDILNDIEAGRRAGCRTILLDSGGETEWVITPQRTPDYTVTNMFEAARLITRQRPLPTRRSLYERAYTSRFFE